MKTHCRPQRSVSGASIKNAETSAVRGCRHPKLQEPPANPAKILLSNIKNEIILKTAPRVIFRPPKLAPMLIHVTCVKAVCPQNSGISLAKPPKVTSCRRLLSRRDLRDAKVVKNGSFLAKVSPFLTCYFQHSFLLRVLQNFQTHPIK